MEQGLKWKPIRSQQRTARFWWMYIHLHPLDIKWFFYSVLTVSQPQNKTWGWGPLCEAANRMEVRRSELWNWKGQGSHFPLITVPRCPLEARCEWRDLCPVLCRSWWLNLAKDSSLHCPLTAIERRNRDRADRWLDVQSVGIKDVMQSGFYYV